jgi:hypothetical protein
MQQTIQVKLTDLHGRTVIDKQINTTGGQTIIDMPPTVAGIYLLKLTTDEGTQVFKLLKK